MIAHCALRWFAVSALALPFAPAGVTAQRAVRSHFGSRLHPGSDRWFAALFKLTNPVEGGPLHFLNNHLVFTQNSVNFTVRIPDAVISFATTDSARSNAVGGGQWSFFLPISFNEQLFFTGMSWDPEANLPAAYNQVHFGNLLVMVGAASHRKPRRPR